jgi:transposase
MQGVQAFDPPVKSSIDLESFVSEDHFLRQIDRVLDLAFVRELTAACYTDGKGRPSIDPEVFFRMQLVAYFNGITKDRRLCEEVRYNLAYRWFWRLSLGEDVPDHSSLSRIRDRLGEEIFEKAFGEIVGQCKKKGLVKDECRVMTDATLIAADASLDSLIHHDPEQARIEAESQRRRPGMLDPSANRRVSNRTHRSCTDPEATLAQKRGTALQLKYKVHQTIGADSRIILDTEVTTGGRHDNQPYLKQLRRVEDRCHCTIHEATADRGYGSAEILKALKAKGAKTYIPLWHGRSGRNSGAAVGMNYKPEQDRIRCPAGKYLYPSRANYENRRRFVSPPVGCRSCALASLCPAKSRPRSPHTRFVIRPMDQGLFDRCTPQLSAAVDSAEFLASRRTVVGKIVLKS